MGNNLESKEVAMAGAIPATLILGYSEEERIKSKQRFQVIIFRDLDMPWLSWRRVQNNQRQACQSSRNITKNYEKGRSWTSENLKIRTISSWVISIKAICRTKVSATE